MLLPMPWAEKIGVVKAEKIGVVKAEKIGVMNGLVSSLGEVWLKGARHCATSTSC